MLRDGGRRVGIAHEVVGENHHVVGIAGVGKGIAQGAADALGILGTGETAGVAHRVAGRSAEEGHVDMDVAIGDGRATATMGTEHHRLLEDAVADGLGQLATHTGGGDAGHDAILDVLDEGLVDVVQAGSSHVEVLDATTEVVVEGYRHAVLQTGTADSLLQRNHLLALSLILLAGRGDLALLAVINILLQVLGHLADQSLSFL